MDELIVKVLRGEATDFEVRQLEHWRHASEDHESEFLSVQALWDRAGDVPQTEVPPPPPLSEILMEGDRRRKRASARHGVRKLFRSPFVSMGLSAAAVVALLVVGFRGRGGPDPLRTGLSPVESSSTSGDVTTMGLSDGSVVRLASGSRIEFPPDSEGRNVVVEGKAFFAVASGEDPFVVWTRAGEVTVRGTRFEVEAVEDALRVVVLEGLVEVGNSNGVVAQVGPGQVAFLSAGGEPRIQEAGDLRAILDWPGGLMVFQETPFADVAREVGANFGVTFEAPPGELAQRRVTAWFGEESLEEVVRGVCMVVGARCEVGNDGVIVR